MLVTRTGSYPAIQDRNSLLKVGHRGWVCGSGLLGPQPSGAGAPPATGAQPESQAEPAEIDVVWGR